MSLLAELQQKRKNLKATETVITTTTGERFLETQTALVKLQPQKYGFVEDTKPDQVPAEIMENFLYLGSQDAVCLKNCIDYKFTHILSVGVDVDTSEIADILLGHKFLPLLDLPETKLVNDEILNEAFQFIELARETSNGRILVHCNAGVSRAASVVIAYLMRNQRLSFEVAYQIVKSKRPCIQPNAGFMKQLREWRL